MLKQPVQSSYCIVGSIGCKVAPVTCMVFLEQSQPDVNSCQFLYSNIQVLSECNLPIIFKAFYKGELVNLHSITINNS